MILNSRQPIFREIFFHLSPWTTATSACTSATILAGLDIEFASQTAHYQQVSFQLVSQGNETKISGTIPLTLSDFKIDPPSLLTLPVKNEVPLRVEMTWHPL